MKRLLALCVVATLLLAACGKTPETPVVSTALAEPTFAEETTSEEPASEELTSEGSTAKESTVPKRTDTDFTVTGLQLLPPAQNFDAEFEAFYKEFTAAVRREDIKFIDGILDEGVMSSFGGVPGPLYFYDYWTFGDLWAKLNEIIALGGVYDQAKKSFVAPYLFKAGLEDEQFAVIGKNVPVYESKSTDAKVIAKLEYDVLGYHYSDAFHGKGPDDFVSVATLSGKTGFIQKKYLRSPIDYRLCIEQKDGAWKLLWLIAGD